MSELRNKNFITVYCVVIGLALLLLMGCSESTEPPVIANDTAEVETLVVEPISPVTSTNNIVSESPIPTPVVERGPDFEIDPSVQINDTVVRGTGPASIAINIVDVNWGGEIKGTGVISEDGTFVIDVTPVEAGHMLGITLQDLSGSEYTADDFKNNEDYRDIPLVGFLVATHEVPME